MVGTLFSPSVPPIAFLITASSSSWYLCPAIPHNNETAFVFPPQQQQQHNRHCHDDVSPYHFVLLPWVLVLNLRCCSLWTESTWCGLMWLCKFRALVGVTGAFSQEATRTRAKYFVHAILRMQWSVRLYSAGGWRCCQRRSWKQQELESQHVVGWQCWIVTWRESSPIPTGRLETKIRKLLKNCKHYVH